MTDETINVTSELRQCMKQICEENLEIQLVSLCTTDGFSVKHFAAKKLNAEADKLAAMSSTIAALSDSSSSQILQSECDTTIVETANGHLLFVKSTYLGMQCVLTMATNTKMSLAIARFKTKGLAKEISALTAD